MTDYGIKRLILVSALEATNASFTGETAYFAANTAYFAEKDNQNKTADVCHEILTEDVFKLF